MRLTVCLCSGARDLTARRWNNLWKVKGRFYDHPAIIPQALLDKGIQVVEVNKIKPEEVTWIPTVDDPRYAKPIPPEEQLDWNADPVYTHSSNIRLFEGVTQACLIAKAQHFHGFPPAVERLIGNVDIPEKVLMLQRSIMLSQMWNTDETKLPKPFDPSKPRWHWTASYGITKLKSSQILMRNLLRHSRSEIYEFPSLRNRKQFTDIHLHSYVNYRGKPIVMKEDLDWILTSDQLLPPFADMNTIDASVLHKLPDMWPIYPTVDFLQSNNYELTNKTGFKTDDKFTCPHTIVQFPQKYHWEDKHYKASQIMTCLMYTAALARRKFGENVKVLPEPISIQHVFLEQDHFLFTFFQLNTLDLDSDTGVKNFAWTTDRAALYKKIFRQPWFPRERKLDRYMDFDQSAFDKFLAVYFSGVPEVSALKG